MLMLPQSVRIFLAAEPADMRNAMDGLAALVRQSGGDPLDGNLYVFLSRRRDRAKILAWTRGGYVLWYRRLERGRFQMPPVGAGARKLKLDAGQLAMLLDGIDFSKVKRASVWEPKEVDIRSWL